MIFLLWYSDKSRKISKIGPQKVRILLRKVSLFFSPIVQLFHLKAAMQNSGSHHRIGVNICQRPHWSLCSWKKWNGIILAYGQTNPQNCARSWLISREGILWPGLDLQKSTGLTQWPQSPSLYLYFDWPQVGGGEFTQKLQNILKVYF